MKVKLNDTYFQRINLSFGLERYSDIVTAMFQSIKALNQALDLTVIGVWNNVEECNNFIEKMFLKELYRYSNLIEIFNELDGAINIAKESKKVDTMAGGSDTRTMTENSPITTGESFEIDTPSNKSLAKVTSNGTHTITDTNLNQQIDVLDFRIRTTSIYMIIEKCLLSLTDEYTTAY